MSFFRNVTPLRLICGSDLWPHKGAALLILVLWSDFLFWSLLSELWREGDVHRVASVLQSQAAFLCLYWHSISELPTFLHAPATPQEKSPLVLSDIWNRQAIKPVTIAVSLGGTMCQRATWGSGGILTGSHEEVFGTSPSDAPVSPWGCRESWTLSHGHWRARGICGMQVEWEECVQLRCRRRIPVGNLVRVRGFGMMK